jgi:hypothetical protein
MTCGLRERRSLPQSALPSSHARSARDRSRHRSTRRGGGRRNGASGLPALRRRLRTCRLPERRNDRPRRALWACTRAAGGRRAPRLWRLRHVRPHACDRPTAVRDRHARRRPLCTHAAARQARVLQRRRPRAGGSVPALGADHGRRRQVAREALPSRRRRRLVPRRRRGNRNCRGHARFRGARRVLGARLPTGARQCGPAPAVDLPRRRQARHRAAGQRPRALRSDAARSRPKRALRLPRWHARLAGPPGRARAAPSGRSSSTATSADPRARCAHGRASCGT